VIRRVRTAAAILPVDLTVATMDLDLAPAQGPMVAARLPPGQMITPEATITAAPDRLN